MVKVPHQEKEWSRERSKNLAEDLDILLNDLCGMWGFCNGLTGWELARDGQTITADIFADAVVAAEARYPSGEGLDPDDVPGWVPKLRAVFLERYGPSVSENEFAQRPR